MNDNKHVYIHTYLHLCVKRLWFNIPDLLCVCINTKVCLHEVVCQRKKSFGKRRAPKRFPIHKIYTLKLVYLVLKFKLGNKYKEKEQQFFPLNYFAWLHYYIFQFSILYRSNIFSLSELNSLCFSFNELLTMRIAKGHWFSQ